MSRLLFQSHLSAIIISCIVISSEPLVTTSLAAQDQAHRMSVAVTETPGGINVDGVLDDAAWQTAEIVPLPYEVTPGNNTTANAQTECRITFDNSHLYFGCKAQDNDPGSIRAYLTDRDDIDEQDRIGILLDPFRDSRRGFAFVVTASGVQGDYSSSGDEDPALAWDAIWDAESRRTSDGYVVEAAIPFRSLRFSAGDGAGSWNFYFWREVPRSISRENRSIPHNRGNKCSLCQLATLHGLTNITPGRNIDLTPTVTTARSDARVTPGADALTAGEVDPDVGLDLRWSPTPSLTLNAALNPDFNQVESDVARLVANEQFALFFPERRPFFLEGSELFDTPMRTVFTRSVADPSFGAKVTGKEGGWAFGAMVARDEVTNLLFPGSLSSRSASLPTGATTVLARARRDVGRSNTVGALVTNREGAEGYHNRLVSLDSRVQLAGPLSVVAQVTRSETAYPEAIAVAHDQPVDGFGGTAAMARLDLESSEWFGRFSVERIDSGFRADAGFIPQSNRQGVDGRIERKWWPSESFFTKTRVMVGGGATESRAHDPLRKYIFTAIGFNGRGQSNLSINPDFNWRDFEGEQFGIARLNITGEVQPVGDVEIGFFGQFGEELDFANAREASMTRLRPRVDLRLGQHVDLQLQYDYKRLSTGGATISTERLGRIRAVYHFSRRLFLRTILQYRALERDPALFRSPVEAEVSSLATQFLLSYTLNPASVVFLGYADEAVEDDLTRSFEGGLRQTQRNFFLKLSYTWRP